MIHSGRIPSYLLHLVVACNRIRASLGEKTEATFLSDVVAQDAVLRQIEVLGEAAKRIRDIDEAFFERHRLGDLYRIIGMRNRIAHEYLNVDAAVIWQVVSKEAPELRDAVLNVLKATGMVFDPDALHF